MYAHPCGARGPEELVAALADPAPVQNPPATASPSDAEWNAAADAHLRRRVPELLPRAPQVTSHDALTDDVWLLHLSHGDPIVAKHQFYGLVTRGEPYDLLSVEQQVLTVLREAGHPVPSVLATDPEGQFIFLECVGPRTLAAALASRPSARQREGWARQVLDGLIRIEHALATDPRWEQVVIPGAGRRDLDLAWSQAGQAALEGLDLLLRRLGAPRSTVMLRRTHAALEELTLALGRRPPDLGVTDYQSGNVVIDESGERLTFLEFAKLGWDWTERRAVQYATSADADALPGLLDSQAVGMYGDLWEEVHGQDGAARRRALDGHHTIFHLLLGQRLCGSSASPAPDVLGELTRALTTPLCSEGLATEFRRRFSRLIPPQPG